MPQRSREHAAFGQAVRQLRESLDLSQEQLGYKTGLHRNYIGGVERGELNASLASIIKLASGLGVAPSELVALGEKISRSRTRSRSK
jgi:transcriptional regulator with XRE-family HTH domain